MWLSQTYEEFRKSLSKAIYIAQAAKGGWGQKSTIHQQLNAHNLLD